MQTQKTFQRISRSVMAFCALSLLNPAPLHAEFNMREASFIKTMNEFPHPILSRTYQSRSLWKGQLGFGWCSSFERSLKVLSSTDGLLLFCDQETKVNIEASKGQWIYRPPKGLSEKYNSKGQLIEIGKGALRFKYDLKGRLTQIQSKKETYSFTFSSESRFVRQIKSSHGTQVSYQYRDENLIQIHYGKLRSYELKYDSFHNLIEFRGPAGHEELITYNENSDEISSYRSHKACPAFFKFQKISSLALKSSIEKRCPASLPQTQVFVFLGKKSEQGKIVHFQTQISGDANESANLP